MLFLLRSPTSEVVGLAALWSHTLETRTSWLASISPGPETWKRVGFSVLS